MSYPIETILIGAGNRGREVYGNFIAAHPELFRMVAVAEPLQERREMLARQHGIDQERCFTDWQELLEQRQLAQAAIITTQDRYHTAPALAALRKGYEVLLEKPMAPNQEECLSLVRTAEAHGRLLQICHVLRYTAVMQKLKQLIKAGTLGEIITVEHRENLSFAHMAHSYVRGNWRNLAESSPMILAKCCHDFDLLYWLLGRQCLRLSSFGSCRHFRRENAPQGATARCSDGCPIAGECPYNAVDFYIRLLPILHEIQRHGSWCHRLLAAIAATIPGEKMFDYCSRLPGLERLFSWRWGWPRSVITSSRQREDLWQALGHGPYGRCVYYCDNDVVDHQVVAMEFAGGISATLTMQGHSHQEGRTMRWDGSRATIFVAIHPLHSEIVVHHHRDRHCDHYRFRHNPQDGHSGGDSGLLRAFARAVGEGERAPLTNARDSLESHLLGFAAETARRDRCIVEMDVLRSRN